jgi:predicted GNAT superfamily acetyltransferase
MIEIRACSGFDELEACVQLQIETWGYDASDVLPRKAFRVAQKIGGQVIGAFDSNSDDQGGEGGPELLVGFALSLPGIKNGGIGSGSLPMGCKTGAGLPLPYLHSHMLAVREEYRNRGIGAQLKLEQRREALARGIRQMEWTFDPLEVKNAFLNIHKLGAIACRYEANFYGVSSSRLQGGLPTDRLVAEWQLDSPRVEAASNGLPADAHLPDARHIEERIVLPAFIHLWKAAEADRERALAVQFENRRRFQEAFSRGLAVVGFTLDAEGNGVFELGPLAQAEAGLNGQRKLG